METTREFERNRELASQLSLNFVLYIISISGCFGVPVCVEMPISKQVRNLPILTGAVVVFIEMFNNHILAKLFFNQFVV